MQIIVNGILAGLTWSLVALGFNIVYSTARFIHVAHAATFLVGAYIGMWITNIDGFPCIIGVFLAISAAAIFGCLIELVIYRPLRKRGSSSLIFFLASFALLLVVQNVISLCFGNELHFARACVETRIINIYGAKLTLIRLLTAFIAIFLIILVWIFTHVTRIGKQIRAVASDPELSEILGINCDYVLFVTSFLGSCLAGVAGILFAFDAGLTPSIGITILLISITTVIIGGIGSIPGTLLGGLFLGLSQHIGVWHIPAQWQDAIVFLILISFLLIRPQGFLGKPLKSESL